MSICVECLKLKKQLAESRQKYDYLLIEHSKLLETSTRLLQQYEVVERQEQINLTNLALKSFENSPITLAPIKDDDNDG